MATIGVLGARWRAEVGPDGTIVPRDGAPLRWHVAADDRWHTPSESSSLRQRRVEGMPVVETRMRIPGGDVIERVYAVADRGGLTVVQVENDSPLPIAVAFEGRPVSSARPAAVVPIEGIELAAGTSVFPIGHRTTLTVALPHTGPVSAPLPIVPGIDAVVRGWTAILARAGTLTLPDATLVDSVAEARCELLLAFPDELLDDQVEFAVALGEITRLGTDVSEWTPELAAALSELCRRPPSWDVDAALDAGERVLVAADEQRAVRDLRRTRARREPGGLLPATAPAGVRVVPWIERSLLRDGVLLPDGIPPAWAGQSFEAHGLPGGGESTVSFAVRWHGERPAILWEVEGAPLELRSPKVAPGWVTTLPTGEALWPPFGAPTRV